jgi:ankyrin repeat protein
MADDTTGPPSLPEHPDLDWLRKQAKRRLHELRTANPAAKLAGAQFDLARRYGFASWRALKAHIDSLTVEGRLVTLARDGDAAALAALLDEHPARLHLRAKPWGTSLLHVAAQHGRLGAVDLLLARGLDPNLRERGDNTYPMHWAAAGGHVDVVRRLADAGGDVVGSGDDHELEVIGWATCWPGCDDDAHRAVAAILLNRGARHHIFSAIAMNLADEVRRIVAVDPAALNRRMSRNENHQLPLHFAVRVKRPDMLALLVELGADPLGVDGAGFSAAFYANGPGLDAPLLEKIRELTMGELRSAARGDRRAHGNLTDLVAVLALGDGDAADRLLTDDPKLIARGGAADGALHVLAKRGDTAAVDWLLRHGADPNGTWGHWDAKVTPLHLAAAQGHVDVVRRLLAGGADPTIRDSKHDGDAIGWAQYGSMPQAANWRAVVEAIEAHLAR